MTALGIIVTAIGMALTAAGGYYSYHNGMFWPQQVIDKWGQAGISFITHLGMWSDFFLLAPVCGWVVSNYGHRWLEDAEVFGWQPGTTILGLAAIIGFVLAAGNHVNLMFNQKIPDPQGWQKEWISTTIILHFFYFWGAATILVAVCFTRGVDPTTVMLLAIFVGLHMTSGIHIPTGIANRAIFHSHKLPEFLKPDSIGLLCGIWVVALGATAYASRDLAAMLIVGVVGVSIIAFTMMVYTETEPVTQ